MNDAGETPGRQQGVEACRTALEAHFAAHRTIPSMAGLAQLWGYASKSSAARRVDQLIAAGALVWSADRRLAPGPAFRAGPEFPTDDAPATAMPSESLPAQLMADPLSAALDAWAVGYDPGLVHAYSLTARLLRLSRLMERRIGRSAASEGMTTGELYLLDALYRVGPPHRIAPTALKHYFVLSLAGVAKRVDRLETLGFIERVPNPADRRGLFIALTEAGHAALQRLVAADRTAPHIMWANALSETQFRAMQESLSIAERIMAAEDDQENDRS